MEVKYDIPQYVASTKMSSKIRVLVEGKDDRNHISNLLYLFNDKHRVKIDTAENIRGDDHATAKNNRAKLDKIHTLCDYDGIHKNLFILRDREYHKFTLEQSIIDSMPSHESDGNLSWTIGHSLENYFFKESIMTNAYRFLSGCEFKNDAILLFSIIFKSALKIISAISLSARDINKSSYPAGVISWSDFSISNDKISFDVNSWMTDDTSEINIKFKNGYNNHIRIIETTNIEIIRRIGRGHTMMILLQRVFSSCIYHCGFNIDENRAREYANEFSKIKEPLIASALGEAWISSIKDGNIDYPSNLISALSLTRAAI